MSPGDVLASSWGKPQKVSGTLPRPAPASSPAAMKPDRFGTSSFLCLMMLKNFQAAKRGSGTGE
jgi:hypothetical protein